MAEGEESWEESEEGVNSRAWQGKKLIKDYEIISQNALQQKLTLRKRWIISRYGIYMYAINRKAELQNVMAVIN